MKKNIPEAVRKEAKDLISRYGESIDYLGEYQDDEAYLFVFPENMETGFPFIYLYDKASDQAMTITGFKALDILSSFA
jgi:hypothetical protein